MKRKNNNTIGECTLAQLHKLLSLAAEGTNIKSSLPAQAKITNWRGYLEQLNIPNIGNGKLLIDMICSSQTSIETLRAIKDKAKLFYKNSDDNPGQTASLILYNAAIAATFSFHGKEISSRKIQDFIPLFGDLALALKEDSLSDIFRNAVRRYEKFNKYQ